MQLHLYSDNQMNVMGRQAYDEIKQQTPESTNPRINKIVQCVAASITRETDLDVRWEVTVFEDPGVNAFALPGGKIGVNTGLLRVTQNQDQLAAVIGHEVGHVIAQHSNARLSAAQLTNAGLQAVDVMAATTQTPARSQVMGLLGLGAQMGIMLPYGRSQEKEADIVGLDLMARAGFNPYETLELWKNMAAENQEAPPEILSTHPSNETRLAELAKQIPEAEKTFEKARSEGKNPDCD